MDKDVAGAPTKVANLTSTDFELSKDTIDATNKDGGSYKEFLVGLSGWTMNAEGIFEEDGKVLPERIYLLKTFWMTLLLDDALSP
jgi:predicted secreted protein